jgi:hypothetical protein
MEYSTPSGIMEIIKMTPPAGSETGVCFIQLAKRRLNNPDELRVEKFFPGMIGTV